MQLDLFGDVLAAERRAETADVQRQIDGLTCLRDAVPEALQLVAELQYTKREDTRSPSAAGPWAWCVSRAGLRFEDSREWWKGARERRETWGWNRTPANLLTWDELIELVGSDHRRAELTTWIATLPEPRWRVLTRPHELDVEPDGWHVSYLCGDHVNQNWTARRTAWRTLQDLINTAINHLQTRKDIDPR